MMTGVGMLLGTAAYMSPEQAKGREADKRSDIWAFGCVLYEMLTGRRAFDGDDITDVLGAVRPPRAGLGGAAVRRAAGRFARCCNDAWSRIAARGSPNLGGPLHPRSSCRPRGRRRGLRSADVTGPLLARLAWMAAAGGLARCWPVPQSGCDAPGAAFGGPHDDHHVGIGCVIAVRATIATWRSRPTVRASSIAAITSCSCVR